MKDKEKTKKKLIEQDADIAFYEEVLAEAKPLYDQYLEECK